VKVAREEVLKDDVGAVDPEGGLTKGDKVSAEVDVKEVTRDKVGAKVTDDKVVWDHKVGDTKAVGETPVLVISVSAVSPGFTVSSVVFGEDAMVKQRTAPSCLRNRLPGSLDPPIILACTHDCAGWPRHCLFKLDT
jgi:hypothetical protein